MRKVQLQQKDRSDGTTAFTIKCGLEEVHDIDYNLIDNPVRTLVWNHFLGRYTVLPLEERPPLFEKQFGDRAEAWANANTTTTDRQKTEESTNGWRHLQETEITLGEETPPPVTVSLGGTREDIIAANFDSDDTILARECWCARVFNQEFYQSPGEPFDNNEAVLDVTSNAVFCPLDTNLDGGVSKKDVRICSARAVYSRSGDLLERTSACYSEEPMSEFSKSSWPLCFFWWILLCYALVGTSYGRRVRSYMWRSLVVGCVKCRRGCGKNKQADAETNNNNSTTRDVERGGADGENPGDTPQGEEQQQQEAEDSRIEELFGTRQNYDLLDRELQHQADLTNNEYVTWLWYSAIYTEVRRFRTERRRGRRQQRRNNSNNSNNRTVVGQLGVTANRNGALGDADDAEGDEDPTTNNEDNNEDDNGGSSFLGSRTLDRVYWWPPSGPDGTRWEYLRRRNNGDDSNNPTLDPTLDPCRLCLKTRVFRLSEIETPEDKKKEDGIDSTRDDEDETSASLAFTDITEEIGSSKAGETETDAPSASASLVSMDATEEASITLATTTVVAEEEVPTDIPQDNKRGSLITEVLDPDAAARITSSGNTNNNICTDYFDDDDIPDNLCSICLCELEDGDVIGDIPCGHRFHKDCLKAWLTKNNHCPVCRMPNIAAHPPRPLLLNGEPAPPLRVRRGSSSREPPAHTLSVISRFEIAASHEAW